MTDDAEEDGAVKNLDLQRKVYALQYKVERDRILQQVLAEEIEGHPLFHTLHISDDEWQKIRYCANLRYICHVLSEYKSYSPIDLRDSFYQRAVMNALKTVDIDVNAIGRAVPRDEFIAAVLKALQERGVESDGFIKLNPTESSFAEAVQVALYKGKFTKVPRIPEQPNFADEEWIVGEAGKVVRGEIQTAADDIAAAAQASSSPIESPGEQREREASEKEADIQEVRRYYRFLQRISDADYSGAPIQASRIDSLFNRVRQVCERYPDGHQQLEPAGEKNNEQMITIVFQLRRAAHIRQIERALQNTTEEVDRAGILVHLRALTVDSDRIVPHLMAVRVLEELSLDNQADFAAGVRERIARLQQEISLAPPPQDPPLSPPPPAPVPPSFSGPTPGMVTGKLPETVEEEKIKEEINSISRVEERAISTQIRFVKSGANQFQGEIIESGVILRAKDVDSSIRRAVSAVQHAIERATIDDDAATRLQERMHAAEYQAYISAAENAIAFLEGKPSLYPPDLGSDEMALLKKIVIIAFPQYIEQIKKIGLEDSPGITDLLEKDFTAIALQGPRQVAIPEEAPRDRSSDPDPEESVPTAPLPAPDSAQKEGPSAIVAPVPRVTPPLGDEDPPVAAPLPPIVPDGAVIPVAQNAIVAPMLTEVGRLLALRERIRDTGERLRTGVIILERLARITRKEIPDQEDEIIDSILLSPIALPIIRAGYRAKLPDDTRTDMDIDNLIRVLPREATPVYHNATILSEGHSPDKSALSGNGPSSNSPPSAVVPDAPAPPAIYREEDIKKWEEEDSKEGKVARILTDICRLHGYLDLPDTVRGIKAEIPKGLGDECIKILEMSLSIEEIKAESLKILNLLEGKGTIFLLPEQHDAQVERYISGFKKAGEILENDMGVLEKGISLETIKLYEDYKKSPTPNLKKKIGGNLQKILQVQTDIPAIIKRLQESGVSIVGMSMHIWEPDKLKETVQRFAKKESSRVINSYMEAFVPEKVDAIENNLRLLEMHIAAAQKAGLIEPGVASAFMEKAREAALEGYVEAIRWGIDILEDRRQGDKLSASKAIFAYISKAEGLGLLSPKEAKTQRKTCELIVRGQGIRISQEKRSGGVAGFFHHILHPSQNNRNQPRER